MGVGLLSYGMRRIDLNSKGYIDERDLNFLFQRFDVPNDIMKVGIEEVEEKRENSVRKQEEEKEEGKIGLSSERAQTT